jgi:poly-beta-1,6-N-acetyl-D-glucosamine N-deacetylase
MTSAPTSIHTNPHASPLPGPARRARGLAVTAILAVTALAYLVLPALWQWTTANPYHVHDQITTIIPGSDTTLLARLRAIPAPPADAPPVVLVYHDISNEPGFYTVTPTMFAAQMQFLHEAGYNTITAAQLDSWLHGGTLPPRPVLLTFDDGVEGVWQAADPILARYKQHAMAFIITGFVGTRRSYYMNWPEITSLAASGRWDIESHTHVGHVNFTIDAQYHQGPFLTNRHYLAAEHRVETIDEYRTRITRDLAQSINQIKSRGLPAPLFFAYPYSAATGDPVLTTILQQTVRDMFHASMLNETGGASTAPADLAAGNIHRTDVTANMSLAQWVDNIEKSSPLAPGSVDPLTHPNDWTDASGHPIHLTVTNGTATIDPGPRGWTGLLFARKRSVHWRDYAVSAILGGLGGESAGATTGLRVLADSPQQVQLTVSNGSFEVRKGSGAAQGLLVKGNLTPNSSYAVRLDVNPNAVTVTVEGRQITQVPLLPTGTQPATGGIEITGQREKLGSSIPHVSNLVVTQH